MITAFVSLGSNMGDSEDWLAQGRAALAALEGVRVDALSPIYHTEPQGLREQPWFANQVLRLQCAKSWQAQTLMQALLQAETDLGRVRATDPALRNGPRCIDMDLLLFGDVVSAEAFCCLPHPRMKERAFVLVPLRDIDPKVSILGQTVEELLQCLSYSLEGQRIRQ